MKVKELIELLKTYHQEAEVVIHRDSQNFGYGKIDKIITGVFETTEYGNDFWPDQGLIVSISQIRSICLYPEDCDQTVEMSKNQEH